jgi:hypothetical protein
LSGHDTQGSFSDWLRKPEGDVGSETSGQPMTVDFIKVLINSSSHRFHNIVGHLLVKFYFVG